MKHFIASALILVAPALSLAQMADKPAGKPVAKPVVSQAARATAKPAAHHHHAVEAAITPAEHAIAERVQVGHLPCELGASVTLERDAQSPGHFKLQGKGFSYRMRPVETSTGAIRLEDQRAGAVWLQLANKSMLMDQKLGKRLADECTSPTQVAMAEELKKNPPPTLIDNPLGARAP